MAAFKQENWDPQKRNQIEAGSRIRPNDWIMAELIAYQLKTSEDFIETVSGSGEFDNVGKTTRNGAELRLGLYAFEYGCFHADYGYTDAEYDEYQIDALSYSGKKLIGVPEHIVNLEAGYAPPDGLGGRLRYHWEAGYYADNENTQESEDWGRLDAQVSYLFGTERKYRVAFDIINLLDKKYADYNLKHVVFPGSAVLSISHYDGGVLRLDLVFLKEPSPCSRLRCYRQFGSSFSYSTKTSCTNQISLFAFSY